MIVVTVLQTSSANDAISQFNTSALRGTIVSNVVRSQNLVRNAAVHEV